ncbi:hypothetical protein TELCIR_13451 [Teladorsagia circumcincta]|uniref:Uncharacterized protein n=1 Tax=Teladorsagia circumcincta TaxID=45464 RepID=A0A2G9U3Q2_TELCI|nr:hypothetical protein TELCIR_13451 [Teladorsagia circumcincta]
MAAKMVISMCYIIVLLLVTLMAFGVSRQAITYPHEKWNWLLVRTELTSQRVNELLQENCSLKSRLCDVEARLDLIIRAQTEFIDALSKRQKQSKTASSRASTQSLPEADVARTNKVSDDVTSDDEAPSVVVHEPWEDSS